MAGRGIMQGTRSYHCWPDRLEGSKWSKLSTCSIVISVRSLLKSPPGTVLTLSVEEIARWKKDRSVPFIYEEQGTAFLRSVDALPTSRRAADPASWLERLQCLSQTLVLIGAWLVRRRQR